MAVSAKLYKEEAIRDAFKSGILSNEIRQRLLKDHDLSLQNAFNKARSLEIAQKNAEAYCVGPSQLVIPSKTIAKMESKLVECSSDEEHKAAIIRKCKYCGNKKHPRKFCPAKDVNCFNCSKREHFSKVCRFKVETTKRPGASTASLFGLKPDCHSRTYSKVNRKVSLNVGETNALINTGSTLSHLSKQFSKILNLELEESDCSIGLAVKGHISKSLGRCKADVHLNGNEYKNVSFTVLDDLLTDAILGQDFRHKNVKILFGGEIPTLHLVLQAIKTSTPVKLFEHLKENTQPVATKPIRYLQADTEFISSEVKRLLNDDLIEPSSSPWRAQPLVVTQVNHKKRMVIDYSQTVNKFTLLDAYPLPHMQDIVRRIAQYEVYSTLNLTSAYN